MKSSLLSGMPAASAVSVSTGDKKENTDQNPQETVRAVCNPTGVCSLPALTPSFSSLRLLPLPPPRSAD